MNKTFLRKNGKILEQTYIIKELMKIETVEKGILLL